MTGGGRNNAPLHNRIKHSHKEGESVKRFKFVHVGQRGLSVASPQTLNGWNQPEYK